MFALSVRLAVSNERLFMWKKQTTNVRLKPLVLQKQQFNHFALKSLSTACEVVQDGEWALNLTDGFMIQFVIYVKKIA